MNDFEMRFIERVSKLETALEIKLDAIQNYIEKQLALQKDFVTKEEFRHLFKENMEEFIGKKGKNANTFLSIATLACKLIATFLTGVGGMAIWKYYN